MKTIYLIGTCHEYQTESPCCQPAHALAFKSFLLKACRQHGINTVAEELSEEALKLNENAWKEIKEDWERKASDPSFPADLEEKDLKKYEQALEWLKERMSIPQRIETELAKERPIKHILCDPDKEDRAKLGISTNGYIKNVMSGCPQDLIDSRIRREDSIREKFWLSRLDSLGESEWPVLFICGANHVEPFSKLLEENHLNVNLRNRYWKPSMSIASE